jgi:hypothetical protein
VDGALVGAASLWPSFLGPSMANWSQKIERMGGVSLVENGGWTELGTRNYM